MHLREKNNLVLQGFRTALRSQMKTFRKLLSSDLLWKAKDPWPFLPCCVSPWASVIPVTWYVIIAAPVPHPMLLTGIDVFYHMLLKIFQLCLTGFLISNFPSYNLNLRKSSRKPHTQLVRSYLCPDRGQIITGDWSITLPIKERTFIHKDNWDLDNDQLPNLNSVKNEKFFKKELLVRSFNLR